MISPLGQGRVKVGEEAALPPDLRKASGFPATLPSPSSARLEGSAFQPSGGDWLGHMPRGKAKPFRKSGGRAAVGCYPSGTLTRPWPAGGGVIWNGIPHETPVIPAKAGIQSVDNGFPGVCGVDSCFRGNDGAPGCFVTAKSVIIAGSRNWQRVCAAHRPALSGTEPGTEQE